MATTTLYRPVGPAELQLIAASGWKEFPPRLPEQPIFYPVLNEEYAAQIAERWNVRESGAGYVTAFDVDSEYIAKFEVKQVGGREHLELWVPAGELPTFNQHIVGAIRLVRSYRGKGDETPMSTRIASCSCGQLRAEVTGEPVRVSVCHCLACQRRTGGVFATQARFPREAVTISGQGTEFVRVGDEGTKATFTFCPICGCTVFYALPGREGAIAIPVGAFADPTFPAPAFSVYEKRMHSWVTMPQDMEHMP